MLAIRSVSRPVRVAREDPVDVDQPALLVEVAPRPGQVRRHVGDGDRNDACPGSRRVVRVAIAWRQISMPVISSPWMPGLEVERGAGPGAADRHDRQLDRAAVGQLADGHSPRDAFAGLDGTSRNARHQADLQHGRSTGASGSGKTSDFTTTGTTLAGRIRSPMSM